MIVKLKTVHGFALYGICKAGTKDKYKATKVQQAICNLTERTQPNLGSLTQLAAKLICGYLVVVKERTAFIVRPSKENGSSCLKDTNSLITFK